MSQESQKENKLSQNGEDLEEKAAKSKEGKSHRGRSYILPFLLVVFVLLV